MPCYCSLCMPSREWSRRVIKQHVLDDETRYLQCEPWDTKKKASLKRCIEKTRNFLDTGMVQSDDSESREANEAQADVHMTEPATEGVVVSENCMDIDDVDSPNYQTTGEILAHPVLSKDSLVVNTDLVPIAPVLTSTDICEVDLQSERWWDDSPVELLEDPDTPSESLIPDSLNNLENENDFGVSTSMDPEPLPALNEDFLQVPEILQKLRAELLGDYRCPPAPPDKSPHMRPLILSEILSLRHYSAWIKTNGTIEAYNKHAEVLSGATNINILSLREVKKLARNLIDFKPSYVDMCPRSCIAYTGKYAVYSRCPYTPAGKSVPCNEPRYFNSNSNSRILKPRAQVQILPIMARIRAMYANATASKMMRYRDSCLQQALLLMGEAAQIGKRRVSDYGNAQVQIIQYNEMGLFKEARDVALALSTDGAQLTLKKQSNTWLVMFMFLNLPPEIRYQSVATHINFATPGPLPPGDIESYLWTVFAEMARASEGIWTWDAIDSSYFCLRAWISMALGDMLGSAKLNGMAGHTALHGDRFSMVRGAKSSLKPGAKSQYYPSNPPQNDRYNPERQARYDLQDLPMRTQQAYWQTIERLERARTKKDRIEITRNSGISRLPLCAASFAFLHPTFFPLDPFHIFLENIVPLIWDIWTSLSAKDDVVHLSSEKAELFGRLVVAAVETLPPVFCGPIRDPHLKRQSQYKAFEWMALLHWYIIPIGIEIGINPSVLRNFSRFVQIVEFAMTPTPRSITDLVNLKILIVEFLEEFERLYIGEDPEKIHRARLCIFQLIHIPIHIQWNGSIRLGSQATVERAIGEMSHRIRSKKAPFSNLANLIYQRELLRLLALYYPEIDRSLTIRPPNQVPSTQKLFQIRKFALSKLNQNPEILKEVKALSDSLSIDIYDPEIQIERFGKLRLLNGHVLASRSSYGESSTTRRRSEWFEGLKSSTSNGSLFFGNAHAFYSIKMATNLHCVVVYTALNYSQTLNVLKGEWRHDKLEVAEIRDVKALIGIWTGCETKDVYILRKHPTMTLMSDEERGINEIDDGVDNEHEADDLMGAIDVNT